MFLRALVNPSLSRPSLPPAAGTKSALPHQTYRTTRLPTSPVGACRWPLLWALYFSFDQHGIRSGSLALLYFQSSTI